MNEQNNTHENDLNDVFSESIKEVDYQNLTLEQQFDPQISPIAAAFIGLVGGFFLYQIVGSLITLFIFGFSLEDAPVNSLRLITMAGQILFIFLPALVFSKLFYSNLSKFFRLKLPDWKELLLFVVGLASLVVLLQNYLYIQNHLIDLAADNVPIIKYLKELLDKLNEYIEKTYGSLLKANNIFEAFLIIIVVALIPAISEELMFRGYIQRSFEIKMKPFYAALITALFFGANHFNPYGLLPLIILGLYFGYAAYMSGSIFIPIILHFLNNFTAVILYFIFGDDELISASVKKPLELGSSIMILAFMTVIFILIVLAIKRYYSKTINV